MKATLLASVLLVSSGAGAKNITSTEEVWVARINAKQRYLASVIIPTQGLVCKIIQGQKVFIADGATQLPGTDNYRHLSKKDVETLKNAPICP